MRDRNDGSELSALSRPGDYEREIDSLHKALGIAADYRRQCPLPLQTAPDSLVSTEADCFGRPQQLTEAALQAWTEMKRDAAGEGVEMFLVSAFRSPRYQHDLIARKLANGQSIEQVLAVNAAPGYSEHHTGRALDIGAPDCEILTEEFENTTAFQWLTGNAGRYGFSMSYPRGNELGIAYEPWHWCYRESSAR